MDGQVAAVGTLTVSLMDPSSTSARTIITQVALPVAGAGGGAASAAAGIALPQGSVARFASRTIALQAEPPASGQACETLSLTLEAIQLDLLGIPVQLDQVNVDFTVVPGTGARLGGLLCDVNSVMQSAGPVERTNVLNSLLDTIG